MVGELRFILMLSVLTMLSPWVVAERVLAATPYKKALDKKVSAYIQDGVVVGGTAGRSFSLLRVRRDLSKELQIERVILDLGDENGQPLLGGSSYFQATIEENPPRVVIDLAQMTRAGVDEAKLKRIFRRSPYVKAVTLTADPEDNASTLVLHLNRPMGVEVFQMPSQNKASRIVIDLKQMASSKDPKPRG